MPDELDDDRVLVAHVLALPVGKRRVSNEELDLADEQSVAGLDRSPGCPDTRSGGLQLLHLREARHRDPFPDLARTELGQHGAGAADVIGVAVCQHESAQTPHALPAQHWRHNAIPDVEGGVA